jgi:uncharacterized membrane protein YphA (DoxX/SURF4 family)
VAQPVAGRPGGGRTGQGVGLMLIRVAVGAFLLFQGFEKLSWLLDTGPLTKQLASWLEAATPASRWYLERLLPATPVFARLVPLGEIVAGLALVVGFWTRLVAGLAFLMVLNYQIAGAAIFRYSFVMQPNALPVLGALLGLAIGGSRLPLSLSK